MTPAFDPSSSASAAAAAAARRGPALSWSRVVCGEPRAAAPSTSDPADRPPTPGAAAETVVVGRTSPSPPPEGAAHVNDGNAAGQRPAWNVPVNGTSEGDSVMSVGSWPALSELAMAFPRSSSSSQPSNAPADGSNGDPVVSQVVFMDLTAIRNSQENFVVYCDVVLVCVLLGVCDRNSAADDKF
ncbi:hypothetical protein BHM03_00061035 [Ensete ventricosum]|nr:hypothetical protein BHM03_00061035 [Ensete ventricosum]